MRTSGLGERRGSSTSGGLPIESTMLPKRPPQGQFRSSPDTSKSIAMAWPAVAITKSSSTAGHGGEDDDGVAVADDGVEPVQDPPVFVVEVDVDVAVARALLAEELRLGVGVRRRERPQHPSHT